MVYLADSSLEGRHFLSGLGNLGQIWWYKHPRRDIGFHSAEIVGPMRFKEVDFHVEWCL
jgi:hypothetical protein